MCIHTSPVNTAYSIIPFQWQDGFGGICRRITWGCSAIFGSDNVNGNCFYTQYIPLSGANKVFITVCYAAVCTRYPCPTPQEAHMSVYESSRRNDRLGHTDGNHYSYVDTISWRKQSEQCKTFTGTPTNTTDGIYLKFCEENDCITVNRLLVYAEECNEKIDTLLYYPSTYSPDDSVEYTSATGQCLKNSSVATSNGRRTVAPTVDCAAAGMWLPSSGCECNPGHYYNGRDCKGEYNYHAIVVSLTAVMFKHVSSFSDSLPAWHLQGRLWQCSIML